MKTFRHVRDITRYLLARMNVNSERGASSVEYGIMVMLIAAVIIVAVFFLGSTTSTSFSCTAASVQTKAKVAGCG